MFYFVVFQYVSAPTLLLPMDVTVNGVLLGDIEGVLRGGGSTISGRFGTALHANGNQYADYGFHVDKCYHNPDKCSDGITWSLWLNLHAYESVVLDTGATDWAAFGYYIYIKTGPSFAISVKTTTTYHQYTAPYFPLNEWVHVVFTWSASNSGLVHLYINGCEEDASNENGFAYNVARFGALNTVHPFVVGNSPYGPTSTKADIDELMVWDQVLDPLQVW